AYDDLLAEPPKWPKVVGTISIVWGALSVTCAGCGIAGYFLTPIALRMAEEQMGPPPPAMMPGVGQVVLYGLSVLWAVLLIVAGVSTATRNPNGRALHLVWSLGAIVFTIAATAVALVQEQAMADWASQNPDNPWAQQHSPMGTYIGLAVGIVLGLAWPAFC